MTEFLAGLSTIVSSPSAIFWCFLGVLLGTILGALPGLGAVTGIAMLLPLTFHLSSLNGLLLLMCVYMGVQFGGRISAILINIPGDATAVVSTFDGYPLARQGRAGFALTISAIASFIGGLIGIIGLVFLTSKLAQVSLLFGPMDYFALMLFTLIATCGVLEKNR